MNYYILFSFIDKDIIIIAENLKNNLLKKVELVQLRLSGSRISHYYSDDSDPDIFK